MPLNFGINVILEMPFLFVVVFIINVLHKHNLLCVHVSEFLVHCADVNEQYVCISF